MIKSTVSTVKSLQYKKIREIDRVRINTPTEALN